MALSFLLNAPDHGIPQESPLSATVILRFRAATRNRMYTGDGCRHTGTVAEPARVTASTQTGRLDTVQHPFLTV